VDATVTNLSGLPEKVVGYSVAGGINGETAEGILCYFNPNAAAATITLPEGEWNICVNGEDASAYSLGKVSGTAEISGLSALILVKGDIPEKPAEDVEPDVENPTTAPSEQGGEKDEKGEKNNNRLGLWIALGAVAVGAIAVVVVLIITKKK
jgi:pullulanase